jgi:glycolate oxidase
VAENSGGAHRLKNGFTVNHVTGLTVVFPDGEASSSAARLDQTSDLLGAFIGSENARNRNRDHPAICAGGPHDAARRVQSTDAAGEAFPAIVCRDLRRRRDDGQPHDLAAE